MVAKLSDDEQRKIKRKVLVEQRDYLTVELGDPSRYLPFLRSRGILEQSDCERIRAPVTSQEKVEALLTVLETKTNAHDRDAFDVFVEALRDKKVQVHIARTLNRSFVKAKKDWAVSRSEDSGSRLSASSTSVSSRSEDQDELHTPGLPARRVPGYPMQDSSGGESPLTSQGRELRAHPLQQQHSSPTTLPPRHLTSLSCQDTYDIDPDVGFLPNNPPPKLTSLPPSQPDANFDPDVGFLPPHPPRGSTTFTSAQPESSAQHCDTIEPGAGLYQDTTPGTQLHHCDIIEPSSNSSQQVPGGQGSAFHPVHRELHPQQAGGVGVADRRPSGGQNFGEEGGGGWQAGGAGDPRSALPEAGEGVSSRPQVRDLQARLQEREEENQNLRGRNTHLLDKVDRLEKELEDTKEKLRSVTLEAQRQGLESHHPPGSDLDDYAQLQEEKAAVEKDLEEERSRCQTLRQQLSELEAQVHTMRVEPRPTESRPHHLPITKALAASPVPRRHSTDPLSDSSGHFLPSLGYLHPGSISSLHHHSLSGDGGTGSRHSSNTSLSSYASTLSKSSGAVVLGNQGQATLV